MSMRIRYLDKTQVLLPDRIRLLRKLGDKSHLYTVIIWSIWMQVMKDVDWAKHGSQMDKSGLFTVKITNWINIKLKTLK